MSASRARLPLLDVSSACCVPPRGEPLPADQAASLASMFKALGDPVRLRLFSMIAAAGDEVCVCDLTPGLEVSAPTVSHHLKALREAGLVGSERRGTWVYYRLRPEVVVGMAALLAGIGAVSTPGPGSVPRGQG